MSWAETRETGDRRVRRSPFCRGDVDVKDKSLYVTRISADFNLEGRVAGAWLAQASVGQCNIVEEQGTVGSATGDRAQEGLPRPSPRISRT